MHRYDPARQTLAIGLAFLAGAVDATGFLATGGYFASFMSGNTTRLGVDLVADARLVLLPLGIIGSFVGGVIIGAVIGGRWPLWRKRMLLLGVSILLALAAFVHASGWSLGFLFCAACAMGLANNVFARDGEVTVGVTYMTGALVRFGQGLAARLSGRRAQGTRGYGLLWSALALGAVCGAWLHTRHPHLAPASLCALAFALFGAASIIERRKIIVTQGSQP